MVAPNQDCYPINLLLLQMDLMSADRCQEELSAEFQARLAPILTRSALNATRGEEEVFNLTNE